MFNRAGSFAHWRTLIAAGVLVCGASLVASKAIAAAADPDNPFATDDERMAAATSRTWNDRAGKFQIEAKLLKVEDGKVVLRRNDGKEVTVPIEKLSDADQKYVEKFLPPKAATPTEGKSGPEKSTDDAGNMVGSGGVPISATNYTKARTLDLTETRPWTYTPDHPQQTEKLPNARVPLKAVDFFDHLQTILLVPKEKKAFVVFYNDFKTHQSQVQACDLQSGEMNAAAIFGENETPIDISPDATLILSKVERGNDGKQSELHIYNRDGGKIKALKGWRPFVVAAGREGDNFDVDVKWAAFADSQHVLTLSAFGKLVLWDIAGLRPVWGATVAFGTQPTFSAGHKYVVVVSRSDRPGNFNAGRPAAGRAAAAGGGTRISILNVGDGSEAGRFVLDEDPGSCVAALRDDGKRLAVAQIGRMQVWNLENRELIRDFALEHDSKAVSAHQLAWTGDDYLLLNNSIVVDVERRAPIWFYDQMHDTSVVRDGKVWFLDEGAGRTTKVLACATVPNKSVLDSVANLKPEDLLVVHPGMEVAVDLQIVGDSNDIAAIRRTLEERLAKNGMKVVANSKLKLVGAITSGEPAKVRFHSFHSPPSETQEREVQTQVLTLGFVLNGEPIWRYESRTGAPPMMQLQENETIDQALLRIMKQQDDNLPKRFTTIWIPAYLARLPGATAENEKKEPNVKHPVGRST